VIVRIEQDIDVGSGAFEEIIAAFRNALRILFQSLVSAVVIAKGNQAMRDGALAKEFGDPCVWKTKTGTKQTNINTPYGIIHVPFLQIAVRNCKHYVTRWLLGITRFERTPAKTREVYASLATHCRYRAAQGIASILTGLAPPLVSLRSAAIAVADSLHFAPDPKASSVYEADGTGLPITGGGQVYEIKLLVQRVRGGVPHIAGIRAGRRGTDWKPMIDIVRRDERDPVLVQDGDKGIRDALHTEGRRVQTQICTWHLPRALQYAIRSDCRDGSNHGAAAKEVMRSLYAILKTQRERPVIQQIESLAQSCEQHALAGAARYLRKTAPDAQTCRTRGIQSSTTSKTERVMRTQA